MKTPSLDATDKTSKAVQKTANRVSLESIKAKIKSEQIFHPECAPHMTIAILEMANGFVVIGKAAPADAENFDVDVGKQFAREDAIRQIWPLEGYALREVLSQGDAVAEIPAKEDEPEVNELSDVMPSLVAVKKFKKAARKVFQKNPVGKGERDIPQNAAAWLMRREEDLLSLVDGGEQISSFQLTVQDDLKKAKIELFLEGDVNSTFSVDLAGAE